MSNNEIQRTEEAEFDEFLLRQGALSALLASMPQPTPSAELDARILADAQVALAGAPTPVNVPVTAFVPAPALAPVAAQAANDPGPTGTPKAGPSFFSRYRMPMGLAASVVLMMSGVVQIWRNQVVEPEPAPRARMEVAASAAAPAPQPAIVSAPPAVNAEVSPVQAMPAHAGRAAEPMAADKMAKQDAQDEAKASKAKASKAKAGQAEADAISEREQVARLQQFKDQAAQAKANAEQSTRRAVQENQELDTRMKEERKREESNKMTAARAAADSTVLASAHVSNNAPGNVAGVQGRVVAAPELADHKAPSPEMALTKEAPQRKAKKAHTAPQNDVFAADPPPRVVAAPAPPPPVAAAPAPAAAPPAPPPPAVLAQAGASEAAAKPADVAVRAARKVLQAPALPANVWLQKIEKLLQAEKNKEALAEWHQFRTAYPDFVVDKALQTRMDALKP